MLSRFLKLRAWPVVLLACLCFTAAHAQDQPIYTDSLQNGWQNWSWGSVITLNNSSPVHSGTASIAVTINPYGTNSWGAIYLHHTAFDSTPYTNLTFWINGGAAGGQPLQLTATLNGAGQVSVPLQAPAAGTWQQVSVSLASLGVANNANFDGFWIQEAVSTSLPAFYLDDISLVAGASPPVTNTPVTITVDAQLNRRPISPLIYGVAFAPSAAVLSDLNCPLHRSGGNAETSYNWQLNAHNHAADWYFESIDDGSATPAATADSFFATSKSGGAQPMLTIPMIGWAPKLGPNRAKLASYSIAKYGPQAGNDSQWMPDAGDGVGTNTATHTSWLITTNDPNDASLPASVAFEQGFVQHLTNQWGLSTNGGVRFYLMDNEHSIWFSTHRDVHPVGPTMQEIWTKMLATASMVKSNDPNALVLGPEEWGWSGYLYSGYDQQWSGQHGDYNPAHYPDRAANGGWDYLPWLLNQFRQHDQVAGQRLLDYFTLHCYPQENGVSGNDVSSATELLRNQSTRQLWDTNYLDPSWINSIIMLIPRMRNWVAAYYPGTKIGITEYNWGAEGSINGATAQADLLGIFGREGLDLATRWATPDSSTPTYKAMKMFRNYDGADSGFGETSVSATGPNPDSVSTFAALRASDGALTILVINKQLNASATATVIVTNRLLNGAGQAWQLTSANAITPLGSFNFSGSTFTSTVPAQSITLFVLPPGAPPPPPQLRAGTVNTSGAFDLWLYGTAGQRYALQASNDLRVWRSLQTNTLTGSSWHIVRPSSDGPAQFYRGLWAP